MKQFLLLIFLSIVANSELQAIESTSSQKINQRLESAFRVKEGMSSSSVVSILGDDPAGVFYPTENLTEWHYCSSTENLGDFFAVFFDKSQTVIATKRYVVGNSHGYTNQSCGDFLRGGSFSFPKSVKSRFPSLPDIAQSQAQLGVDVRQQAEESRNEAKRLEEEKRKEAIRLAEEKRKNEEEARRKEREAEKLREERALARALEKAARLESYIANDNFTALAESKKNDYDINVLLANSAPQATQVNTQFTTELLMVLIRQNDRIIELLKEQN